MGGWEGEVFFGLCFFLFFSEFVDIEGQIVEYFCDFGHYSGEMGC